MWPSLLVYSLWWQMTNGSWWRISWMRYLSLLTLGTRYWYCKSWVSEPNLCSADHRQCEKWSEEATNEVPDRRRYPTQSWNIDEGRPPRWRTSAKEAEKICPQSNDSGFLCHWTSAICIFKWNHSIQAGSYRHGGFACIRIGGSFQRQQHHIMVVNVGTSSFMRQFPGRWLVKTTVPILDDSPFNSSEIER